MPQITLEQARAAKEVVKKICERLGVDAAVGISRVGDDYAVKVNLSEPPKPDVKLPTQVDGVPLKLEIVGTIRPR
jgi:hypothetical protein